MKLEWNEADILLSNINDYEHNPRSITKKAFERLVESIKQDGYHGRILVDTHGIIIGGHSRKKALLAAGYKSSDWVKVLTPSRELTAEEFKRINIRDNLEFGDFDMDILSSHFDVGFLKDIGMDITFNDTPGLDLEKAELDMNDEKLCKKCPYKEGV